LACAQQGTPGSGRWWIIWKRAAAPLATAVRDIAASASAEISRRDDRWAPVAADVAAWCADAGPARTAAAIVPSIKQARAGSSVPRASCGTPGLPHWPIRRAIWAMLRQESNIDLGVFRLAGTATQRRLELNVSIDGLPGAAPGVMSQGEINALALSRRWTRPKSTAWPGSSRKVAADRRVVVFTHDNRLTAAVRDLNVPATVLEGTRRPGSVRPCPPVPGLAGQALSDASALSADQATRLIRDGSGSACTEPTGTSRSCLDRPH
jgi:hypothetical protein